MKIDTKFVLIALSIILICCISFTMKNKIVEKFADPPTSGTTAPPTSGTTAPPTSGTTAPPSNLGDINTADATLNDLLNNVYNISNVDKNTVTAPQLNDLKNELQSKIERLDTLLNQVNTNLRLTLNTDKLNNPSTVEKSIDEKTTQLLQDKEIIMLTDRLNKLKAAYNTYLTSQKTDGQPKIPIYSSCIVSEASGAYTTDNLNRQNTSLTTTARDSSRPVPTSVTDNNPFKEANITDSEINFDDILNQLSKANLNVNIGV